MRATGTTILLIARLRYYACSLGTLYAGVQDWPRVALAIVTPWRRAPFTVTLRSSGLLLRARSALDLWMIKETCLDRCYERAGVAIEDGWTIIDIGAGLGDFAITAAHGGRNTVYAYEPVPESFGLLVENIRCNGATTVHPFRSAVGPAGAIRLDIVGAAARHREIADRHQSRQSVVAASLTLDEVFASLALASCDYLKIDCEGGEFRILREASTATLRKIRHICLEYHDGFTPYGHDDLVMLLMAHGFRVTVSPSEMHRRIGLLHAARTGFSA